jgi:Peptidase family M28
MYRAAWVLVAVPLLVAAFTVARPSPLPAPPLPPSFDQPTAARVSIDFARDNPVRTPGTTGAAEAAAWVEERLDDYRLSVERQTFEADVPGLGHVELVNLIARPAEGPRDGEMIVVMAHRDNLGLTSSPNDDGSGTGALIELARDLSTISLGHTVVFASVDGGAYGNLGAAELASFPGFGDRVLAVVNLDAIAGTGRARLELAGDRPRAPAGELLTSADASILAETGARATHPTALDQLLDLAFPFSFYGQSPFIAADVSAITITSAGDRPPKPANDVAATFDPNRLGQLGRAAQRLILSLDGAAEIATGTDSYVYLSGRFVRGFAIAFFLVVAILPGLVATADLAARVHRRGIELGPALRSYGMRLLAWIWAAGLAAVFTVAGLFPNGAARPLSPDAGPGVDWPLGAVAALLALSGGGWLLVRQRLLPRRPAERVEELAGHLVVMLVLCAISVGLALANPFSLLLVLPSLHAWLWIPHVRDSNAVLRCVVYLIGFAGPLLVLISFAIRFQLGFDAPWYLVTLFSVGYAPLALFLAAVPWAAAACQAGAILFGRYAPLGVRGDALLVEGKKLDVRARSKLSFAARKHDEHVGVGRRHDHV